MEEHILLVLEKNQEQKWTKIGKGTQKRRKAYYGAKHFAGAVCSEHDDTQRSLNKRLLGAIIIARHNAPNKKK